MGARRPRFGSLQFWPRKRAEKIIPSVNWAPVMDYQKSSNAKSKGLLGFITYKVGMGTAIVKDTTDKSMTAGKRIAVPVTILEAPHMKVFSVRFYSNGKVAKEVVVSQDKELKRIVKVPAKLEEFDKSIPSTYDDIRVIVYSLPSQISLKKTPDMIELAVTADNKLEFVKSLLNKEISLKDIPHFELVDVRALTKGKGLHSAVKRFGIGLRSHKAEKGVRRPGSLGPWHPARVTYLTPMAGQVGMFSRVHYNLKTISFGDIKEKNINPSSGFSNYGLIKGNYLLVKGSVQGPPTRQVLITPSFRPTKKAAKTKLEFVELVL